MAGLLGAFLVFLFLYPWHSDLPVGRTRPLFQDAPKVQSPAGPSRHSLRRVQPDSPALNSVLTLHQIKTAAPSDLISVPLNMFPRRWDYIFEGKATLRDQPCPNASVLVRLTSGDEAVSQKTITGSDGSYMLRIAIHASEGDPVDWTLEANTPDFKSVELSGRRIIQRAKAQELQKEQIPVIVDAPLEFLVSLSKE